MFSLLTNIMGHAYSWLIKLLIIVILDLLFRQVVGPMLEPLRIFIIYIENLALFKILPEAAFLLIQNGIIIFLTYEIFLWIVGTHHKPHHHSERQHANA